MSPIDTLVAIEAIKRVKAEDFRCTDEKDRETASTRLPYPESYSFRQKAKRRRGLASRYSPRRNSRKNA